MLQQLWREEKAITITSGSKHHHHHTHNAHYNKNSNFVPLNNHIPSNSNSASSSPFPETAIVIDSGKYDTGTKDFEQGYQEDVPALPRRETKTEVLRLRQEWWMKKRVMHVLVLVVLVFAVIIIGLAVAVSQKGDDNMKPQAVNTSENQRDPSFPGTDIDLSKPEPLTGTSATSHDISTSEPESYSGATVTTYDKYVSVHLYYSSSTLLLLVRPRSKIHGMTRLTFPKPSPSQVHQPHPMACRTRVQR